MFLNGSRFTGFFAACTLLAAQSASLAAETNAPAAVQPDVHTAMPDVRTIHLPATAGMAIGGLYNVMTEQQRTSYQEAMRDIRPQFLQLDSQLRAARRDLFDTSVSTKFDEAVVRQKAQAVANIEAEITVLRVKALSQVQPPMTPGQIEQIKAEQAAPVRPFQRPLQSGTGAPSANHDPNGLPPKQ